VDLAMLLQDQVLRAVGMIVGEEEESEAEDAENRTDPEV
jgi:hypothetical protein